MSDIRVSHVPDGALVALRRSNGLLIIGQRDGEMLRHCAVLDDSAGPGDLVPVGDCRLVRGGRLRHDFAGVLIP